MQTPIYAYSNSLIVCCKFESEAVLDRFNVLSLVPGNGGPFFDDIGWMLVKNDLVSEVFEFPECGTVTAELLSKWDHIPSPTAEAYDDGDWQEIHYETQPPEVWEEIEGWLFGEVYPLFSEELDCEL